MATFLVLHGPNLNLLGTREPAHYGAATLADINKTLVALASKLGHGITTFQSNDEAVLIERIHQTQTENVDCLLFNPAAFTHTSVALRDAILAINIPMIEIHLSNIHKRETFRHHSYFSDIAIGVISGFGAYSYELALLAADQYFQHI